MFYAVLNLSISNCRNRIKLERSTIAQYNRRNSLLEEAISGECVLGGLRLAVNRSQVFGLDLPYVGHWTMCLEKVCVRVRMPVCVCLQCVGINLCVLMCGQLVHVSWW